MGFPYVGITYCVGGWGIFGVWRILSREMGTVVFGLNSLKKTKYVHRTCVVNHQFYKYDQKIPCMS